MDLVLDQFGAEHKKASEDAAGSKVDDRAVLGNVMALAEGQTDAVPAQNSFPIPGGFSGGHLQLLGLWQWFAPNPPNDPPSPAIGARRPLPARRAPSGPA